MAETHELCPGIQELSSRLQRRGVAARYLFALIDGKHVHKHISEQLVEGGVYANMNSAVVSLSILTNDINTFAREKWGSTLIVKKSVYGAYSCAAALTEHFVGLRYSLLPMDMSNVDPTVFMDEQQKEAYEQQKDQTNDRLEKRVEQSNDEEPTDSELEDLEKELRETPDGIVYFISQDSIKQKRTERSNERTRLRSTPPRVKVQFNEQTSGAGNDDPEGDNLRWYLEEIGATDLLTKDDEQILGRAVKEGLDAEFVLREGTELSDGERIELLLKIHAGQKAKDKFIRSNLRLVVSIAKRYQSSPLAYLDLIQEGNFGLIRAVEKFDGRKGFKFSTYATWWIRQSITRGIANTGRSIRLPVHTNDMLSRLQKVRAKLELDFKRTATVSEIAKKMEMSESKIVEALGYGQVPLSLSQPLNHEGDGVLGDVVEDDGATDPAEEASRSDLPDMVARMLASLTRQEQEVITMRFGLLNGVQKTLEEVAQEFGVNRHAIVQIESRVKSKLRHPSVGALQFVSLMK